MRTLPGVLGGYAQHFQVLLLVAGTEGTLGLPLRPFAAGRAQSIDKLMRALGALDGDDHPFLGGQILAQL